MADWYCVSNVKILKWMDTMVPIVFQFNSDLDDSVCVRVEDWCSFSYPIRHFHGTWFLPLSSCLWLPWRWRQVAPLIPPSRRSSSRCNKSLAAVCRSHHPVSPCRSDSLLQFDQTHLHLSKMREIVHLQAGQCGNQIGAKVCFYFHLFSFAFWEDLCRRARLSGAERSSLIHPIRIL